MATEIMHEYCEILKKLSWFRTWRGMLSTGISILHDNAHPPPPMLSIKLSFMGYHYPSFSLDFVPVTTTCFQGWKNICSGYTSAAMTRWKMQFNNLSVNGGKLVWQGHAKITTAPTKMHWLLWRLCRNIKDCSNFNMMCTWLTINV